MFSINRALMPVDVKIQVERLPNDERYGKVVSHHWRTVYVGGVLVNTEVVNDDSTTSDNVPVEKESIHVKEENCHRRQTPDNCEVKEDRLTQPFTVDEHFWVVNRRVLVGLNVVAVHGGNV